MVPIATRVSDASPSPLLGLLFRVVVFAVGFAGAVMLFRPLVYEKWQKRWILSGQRRARRFRHKGQGNPLALRASDPMRQREIMIRAGGLGLLLVAVYILCGIMSRL